MYLGEACRYEPLPAIGKCNLLQRDLLGKYGGLAEQGLLNGQLYQLVKRNVGLAHQTRFELTRLLIASKPLRGKSVTYVSGITCNPCVRNGPEGVGGQGVRPLFEIYETHQ
jgi:hypothetical protein